ncbi:FkbM family methyltransferase [Desulfovibrio intestinalis]|uniref:FkbM family methyltransferase n=1 Tax=Desulfovibrio intestinalis TaxID=58621 RepID=A0A7W8C378_9BACT|nr:FkbM family methyltransferase [Desulfovibrio intestinalis]MBB5144787.1 FkbM family methyltransferase [Desulfovibrio intestinalis]
MDGCNGTRWKKFLEPAAYVRKAKRIIMRVIGISSLALANLVLKFPENKGVFEDSMRRVIGQQFKKIQLPGRKEESLLMHVNGSLTAFRCETFFSKEPETIEWVDSLEPGSVLWDIGANVGVFSLYAAKMRNCRVLAFEPSIFNLEVLGKNIFLNGLQDKIHIVPVALSCQDGVNTFQMGDIQYGGACSAFGVDFGFDGRAMQPQFAYSLLGLKGDTIAAIGVLPRPDYIKLDVDGIEHFILQGMTHVLSEKNVKSAIIEGNENFKDQVEQINKIMQACGFVLREKRHSEMFEEGKFSGTYNQVWDKV